MDARRWMRLRERLEERKDRLIDLRARNVEGEESLLGEREHDVLDTGADRTAARVLAALAEGELAELARIDAALARMDAGTYGRCLDCGAPIRDGRLDAVPEAARCVECESGGARPAA